MPDAQLTMTFDPNTIEHLGVRMYTTLPPVLSELIANSYDADASWVKLTFIDDSGDKLIVVEDNGSGMSFDDISQRFLHIGRNRRSEEHADTTSNGRKIIGKKGLGKLSFFGIAHHVEISTKKEGKHNVFRMDWDGIKREKREYHPDIVQKDVESPADQHGTTVTLSQLQRQSGFDVEAIADSLSKIFIIDPDFQIIVQHNSADPIQLDNDRKFSGLDTELEWTIPQDARVESDYPRKDQVVGRLMTTKRPISPKTNMRGIALFARKKLVNLPEYFSESTSSHFYSYLTGALQVDFIDDLPEDVIATNRQSLNWDHPEALALRQYLQALIRWLAQDWREKRNEIRQTKITEATGINIPSWFQKVPEEVRSKLEPIVLALVKDAELPDDVNRKTVDDLHQLIPEYPTYHWRHLHPEIRAASESDYKSRDYYRAFAEAAKRYINAVREKSTCTDPSESSMMGKVFGNPCTLQVAHHFVKPDGNAFNASTLENIEEGQKFLSMGVVKGCRNPVSHEEIADLRESHLFTEKDCLDALSVLSHLFSRLDVALKI